MSNNLLVLCDPDRDQVEIARIAARSGATIGLVSTAVRPQDMPAVGCRVEEVRDYGGVSVQALDEPLIAGAALAQLSSFTDAVIVHHLGQWAERLTAHHIESPERLDLELISMGSVMNAGLTDVILVSTPMEEGRSAPLGAAAEQLHRRMLEILGPYCAEVIDLSRAAR
mgnify:CR=1 FL=1